MQNLVLSLGQAEGIENPKDGRRLYVQIVLKVVEDRVTNGVDIAERTDITARQAHNALRVLQHVSFLADWPIKFSRLEIAVVARGIRQSMLDEPMSLACIRPGGFATLTSGGIAGNGCA